MQHSLPTQSRITWDCWLPIQAVIFDRDDTLIWWNSQATAALEAKLSALDPRLPVGVKELWKNWPGPRPRTVDEETDFWSAFWQTIATQYALPPATQLALQDIGDVYHQCFSVFADTIPCLQALRARGLQLAILTNFALPSVHRPLEYVGIDPSWFAVLLSSTMLGIRKPHPEAYIAAAAALKLPPERCLFVDDQLINVEAACGVGMRGVLLDRPGTVHSSHVPCIRDLTQLTDLLRS